MRLSNTNIGRNFNQLLIGFNSFFSPRRNTLRKFQNVNSRQISYYRYKIANNCNFGQHGGYRVSKVPVETKKLIIVLIKVVCKENPNYTLYMYREIINIIFGSFYSLSTIHKFFKEINYSFKKVNQVNNINKFKIENLIYYGDFLFYINNLDPIKIFYMDECHYDGRVFF
jgi:hypothetical protein